MTSLLNAHPIEVVWLIFSVITVMVSVYALRDAQEDLAFLSGSGTNGPRRVVAESNIHQETGRLSVSLIMGMAATASMFLEPPPPELMFLPQAIVQMVAWIIVSMMLITISLLDRHKRRRLAQYAAQLDPIDPATDTKISEQLPPQTNTPPPAVAAEVAVDAVITGEQTKQILKGIEENTSAIEENTKPKV